MVAGVGLWREQDGEAVKRKRSVTPFIRFVMQAPVTATELHIPEVGHRRVERETAGKLKVGDHCRSRGNVAHSASIGRACRSINTPPFSLVLYLARAAAMSRFTSTPFATALTKMGV